MADTKKTKESTKPKTAKVRFVTKAGKSVNVPHSEHRLNVKGEFVGRQVVTFDEKGEAVVPEVTADALVEFFGPAVERV